VKSTLKPFVKLSIVLLVIIFGSIWWIHHLQSGKHKEQHFTRVVMQAVRYVNWAKTLESVGTLVAMQQVNLTAEVGGYVTKINFYGGQYVKQGDLIIQFDDIKAKADYLAKEAAYRFAVSKYQRAKKLLPDHIISQQEMDSIISDVQAKLAERDTTLDYLNKMSIRAPFSGYLSKKDINVGDYIAAGQSLVVLVDRSHLKVEFSIPEEYLSAVKINQIVSLTSSAFPNQVFNGRVSFIAPIVDPQTHMITLQTDVDNAKNILVPGLFVDIKQTIKSQNVLSVPEQCIRRFPDKTIVFRVINQKAIITSVQVGAVRDGFVEIKSGLSPGNIVVVAGQEALQDGQLVEA
jgi:membrane fusion protein (multidrug efflux system)